VQPFLPKQEPVIAVGLIDRTESVTVSLEGRYRTQSGRLVGPGRLVLSCHGGVLQSNGSIASEDPPWELIPEDPRLCRFSLEVMIGIDFHWQQMENQTFLGNLQLIPHGQDHLTVINRVPLETYITSVICSEMNANSHPNSIKSHAVISRSWLLAQLDAREAAGLEKKEKQKVAGKHKVSAPLSAPAEIIRWTDRQAHLTYDVCADDHCQRYQGTGRIDSPEVAKAIAATHGQVLTYEGRACDARFSKCCGGVVEQFQTAWGDEPVPYLVALADGPDSRLTDPPLTEEPVMRRFIEDPPACYCNCTDHSILGRVLNDYDQSTQDFFRWQVRLDAIRASALVSEKMGIDLGRLLAIEPVERGPSGRLLRLRLSGDGGSVVIGKELEIRRALSRSHLYSSAFVVDIEGPRDRPDTFVLTGAGWGHGVGLCQIGAAVMACREIGYRDILSHYYPATRLDRIYD
jgi:peptidoglycan hydrolase-like amidase